MVSIPQMIFVRKRFKPPVKNDKPPTPIVAPIAKANTISHGDLSPLSERKRKTEKMNLLEVPKNKIQIEAKMRNNKEKANPCKKYREPCKKHFFNTIRARVIKVNKTIFCFISLSNMFSASVI